MITVEVLLVDLLLMALRIISIIPLTLYVVWCGGEKCCALFNNYLLTKGKPVSQLE
jgi:hypothetical protein